MKRWLWLPAGLALLGLLASACTSGGGNGTADSGGEPPAAEEASPMSEDGVDEPQDVVGTAEGFIESLGMAQGFLQPFSSTGGLEALSGFTEGDLTGLLGSLSQGGPLEAMLLSEEDVPAGYQELFAGSFDVADPSLDETAMAMSMFADEGGQGGIVSIVMQVEDESVLQEDLGEIGTTDFAEIEQAFDAYALFGIEIANLREVDVSGLGDGGFGFGFTMDFSGLSAEFGEAFEGETADAEVLEFSAMDMEMVMFVDGSVVGIVVTYSMDGGALASRPFAEIMAAAVAAVGV